VAPDVYVAARHRRLYLRLVVDLDVAGGVDLALDGAAEKNVAIDVQLADQAITRAECDRAGALTGAWRFGRRLIRR
jgi:hypothetical protein